MATSRTTPSKRPRPKAASWSPLANVPEKFHTPIYIGLILLSLLVFFGSVVFGGKFFATSDSVSWLSFVPYLDAMAASGEHPFWIPYIFSGMPAYAAYLVTGDRWWDLSMSALNAVERAVGLSNYWTNRVILHYFIYGVGMYLLMRSKEMARSVSLYASLAAMFSTWIIVYVMIGHNTKIGVLMAFPFIFMCLERLVQRWSLLYAGLLVLAVHFMMELNHPQTAFYGLCAVGIWALFEFVGALMKKEKAVALGVARAIVVLAVAGGFAYGMGMDRYMAIAEYTPYSTRGAKALVADESHKDDPADGGHGYKYATDWSFSPEEMITLVVPNYFGFGKMKIEAAGNQMVPTYWGQMPFTDAAHYMGIGVLILGIYGFWANRRNRFVQAMMAIGVFGLLLSFGKNLPVLYDFFYNVVPSFNKFRAPSQSLILLEFVFPVLAAFGLHTLLKRREENDPALDPKKMLRATLVVGGLLLGLLLLISASKGSYTDAVAAAAKDHGEHLGQFKDTIFSAMQTDLFFAVLFGAGTMLALYLFSKGSLSSTAFMGILFVALIADLWRVSMRPMEAVPQEQAFAVFQPTDLDEYMRQDTTLHRMLDLTGTPPNYAARQLNQHILGYHAAKMRIYQDMLDVVGNGNVPTSPLAWNLLNTKYIVSPTNDLNALNSNFPGARLKLVKPSAGGQQFLFENEAALPRAWFVNRVEVADGKATLEKIRNNEFDPRDVAFVMAAPKEKIDPVGYAPTAAAPNTAAPNAAAPNAAAAPDSTRDTAAAAPAGGSAGNGTAGNGTAGNGSATVSEFTPNHFKIAVDAPGTNFLVLSEIYYPPSWKATIDGKPLEILQTNYVLRGMVVPPGKHTIEMRYESASFDTGKTVSLVMNVAMLAMIGGGFYLERRKRAAQSV